MGFPFLGGNYAQVWKLTFQSLRRLVVGCTTTLQGLSWGGEGGSDNKLSFS